MKGCTTAQVVEIPKKQLSPGGAMSALVWALDDATDEAVRLAALLLEYGPQVKPQENEAAIRIHALAHELSFEVWYHAAAFRPDLDLDAELAEQLAPRF